MTRVAVVVASSGRPAALANLAAHLAAQTLPPHHVVYSVTERTDLPPQRPAGTVVIGPRGSCAQRNRGLETVLDDSDVIAFFDDDYVPSRHALAGIAAFFAANPGHAGANGRLLADGVNSAGIAFPEAARLVAAHDAAAQIDPTPRAALQGLCGCHMAIRTRAIGELRFDEGLPLYGWQEDIDFAARVARQGGALARTDAFAGVHCGVKTARSRGLPIGYSQVANPLYLVRKGTMDRAYSLRLIAKNLLANHLKILAREPWADRSGRARGNRLALRHALRGTLDPAHILHL